MSINKQVIYLLLSQLLVIACLDMADPYWPLIVRQIGHSHSLHAQSIWTTLIYMAPYGITIISAPIWAYLGKHLGYKKMIVRACVVLALTQIMIFMASSLWQVLCLRLIQGGFAGFTAAAQAWLLCSTEEKKHGYFIGKVQAVMALGSIIGPVLGGAIAHYISYDAIFLIAGIMFASVCVVLVVVLAETSYQPFRMPRLFSWSSIKAISRENAFLCLLIVGGQTLKWMSASFFSLYVIDNLAGNNLTVGVLYAMIAGAIILSSMMVGRWSYQLNQHVVLARYGLLVCLLTAAISQLLYASSQSISLAVLSSCLWGLCLGVTCTMPFSLLVQRTPAKQKGMVVGLGTSASKLGNLMGIGLGGCIYILTTIQLAFVAIAVGYVLLFIVVLLCSSCLKKPILSQAS
tara:strand:- start:2452 stop:3660 length:1209 start_codon:yes stop_codon:yes gene_type:complete